MHTITMGDTYSEVYQYWKNLGIAIIFTVMIAENVIIVPLNFSYDTILLFTHLIK